MATAFTPTPGNVTLEVMRITINAVAMGVTVGGVEFEYLPEFVEQTVDQYGNSRFKSWNAGERVRVRFGLAETTYAVMAEILYGGTLRSTGGTAVGVGGIYAGSRASTGSNNGVALIFHPLDQDDATLTRDVNVWRGVCVKVDPIKYGPQGATLFMVEYECELDTTKAQGKMLVDFGLAAAT